MRNHRTWVTALPGSQVAILHDACVDRRPGSHADLALTSLPVGMRQEGTARRAEPSAQR